MASLMRGMYASLVRLERQISVENVSLDGALIDGKRRHNVLIGTIVTINIVL